MAVFTDFAVVPAFLSEAFQTQNTPLLVLSSTSTQVQIRNPETGARTILTGTGLSASFLGDELQLSGVLTGVEILVPVGVSHVPTAEITGISWSAAEFILAVNDVLEVGDFTRLDALLSQESFTYDATDAVQGIFVDFSGVTSNITIFGSAFDDWLRGGWGDDIIKPGANNTFDYSADLFIASPGSDTYDLRETTPFAFNELIYGEIYGPIIANIDGSSDTGTVQKIGNGTDTILGVRTAMTSDGLTLQGTDFDDEFTVTGADGGYVEIIGAEGADSYDLTISGTVRLNFAFSWNFSPFQGLVINLDTQQILNDGYGNSETLNLTDAGGWLQLEATENADSIVGSDLDEAFILRGGNDTLDGGGGFDLLRFDRNQMASGVNVDLQTGIATGAWNSGGSTKGFTQRVTGIEEIRGTNAFSDTIRGSAAEEWIEGRGGNDVIDGRGGNDTLIGQDGNDSLLGSVGDDELFGDNGNDTIIGGLGNDYLDGGNGNDRLDASADATGFGDFVRPGLGTNTIIGSSALFNTFGDGIDISYSDLSEIGGLTIRISASGAGTTRSGQIGKVNDTFTFAHYFIGSQDADLIVGANEATGDANAFRFEGYSGQAGNDTIIGGTGGFDRLSYRNDEDDNENTLAVQVNFATGKAIDTYGDTDTFSGIEAVE